MKFIDCISGVQFWRNQQWPEQWGCLITKFWKQYFAWIKNKTGNARITWQWHAFLQPLLQ